VGAASPREVLREKRPLNPQIRDSIPNSAEKPCVVFLDKPLSDRAACRSAYSNSVRKTITRLPLYISHFGGRTQAKHAHTLNEALSRARHGEICHRLTGLRLSIGTVAETRECQLDLPTVAGILSIRKRSQPQSATLCYIPITAASGCDREISVGRKLGPPRTNELGPIQGNPSKLNHRLWSLICIICVI